jgi:hypothetical protein
LDSQQELQRRRPPSFFQLPVDRWHRCPAHKPAFTIGNCPAHGSEISTGNGLPQINPVTSLVGRRFR